MSKQWAARSRTCMCNSRRIPHKLMRTPSKLAMLEIQCCFPSRTVLLARHVMLESLTPVQNGSKYACFLRLPRSPHKLTETCFIPSDQLWKDSYEWNEGSGNSSRWSEGGRLLFWPIQLWKACSRQGYICNVLLAIRAEF